MKMMQYYSSWYIMSKFILWTYDKSFENEYIIAKPLDKEKIPNDFPYTVKHKVNWNNDEEDGFLWDQVLLHDK